MESDGLGVTDFPDRLAEIERLIDEIKKSANPSVRAGVDALMEAVFSLHGEALHRIMDVVWESGETGQQTVRDKLPDDPYLSGLLLMHGLHPLTVEERVEQGLEKVRPYLDSHGGQVELVEIIDGIVRVRMQGTCESCPASSITLQYAIEDAVFEAAPDVVSVEAVGKVEEPLAAGFIPLEQLGTNGHHNGQDHDVWHMVADMEGLEPRTVRIGTIAGRSIAFCRIGEHLYAYDSTCPSCSQSIDGATFEKTAIVCKGCGHSYDVTRAGRSLDNASHRLDPFPLLVENGQVRIAVPA